MHHLLLGHRPDRRSGRRRSRWPPTGPSSSTAAELGLRAHPGARVYVLPCIAGHVGADTAGVILAEEPHQAEAIDARRRRRHERRDRARRQAPAARRVARPTGPAFEGAQISGGQRAAPGAIERVRIDRETLEPRFRVIGVDAWSDEPGFADAAAAETGVTGICGSGIIEVVAELFLAGVITADGVIDGSLAARTPRDRRRTAGRSATSSTSAAGRRPADRASPRTTSGPSSSPRPRSTPASGC